MTETAQSWWMRWPRDGCNQQLPIPVRRRVRAVSTTRRGGVSDPPYDSFNLGFHVGDDPARVEQNRRRLQKIAGGQVELCWLSQVHGTTVVRAEEALEADEPVEADGCVSTTPGLGCVVLTADCLPVVLCDRQATVVAAAHAGWRGLAAGVLEATVESMEVAPGALMAWLGPAIGPDVFEVGDEVREAFVDADEGAEGCFRPSPFHPDDRWVADLYELARRRLEHCGVTAVFGGGVCTYSDQERFFSYRREGTTGRMATAVWLT